MFPIPQHRLGVIANTAARSLENVNESDDVICWLFQLIEEVK